MSKHDRAKQDKALRNLGHANRYRQRECKKCKHRSSRPSNCVLCGGEMRKGKEKSGSS